MTHVISPDLKNIVTMTFISQTRIVQFFVPIIFFHNSRARLTS